MPVEGGYPVNEDSHTGKSAGQKVGRPYKCLDHIGLQQGGRHDSQDGYEPSHQYVLFVFCYHGLSPQLPKAVQKLTDQCL